MAMDKARLGRGLEALLSEPIPESGDLALALPVGTAEVPLSAIEPNPHQPRKSFDQDELSSLTESIRNHGVLQPLVVRPVGDHFQLIAGERRLRAAQTAGLARCRSTSSISTISRSSKPPWSRTSSAPTSTPSRRPTASRNTWTASR